MLAQSASGSALNFLWLEITAKCNLECMHCYSNSSPRETLRGRLQTDNWLAILQEAATVGCRQLQFIGGEPTLHPELKEMIAFARSQGYTFIEVFTNATTINNALLTSLIENDVQVATSFYSIDPAVHDLITNHPGSFDLTLANIKRLVATGVPLRVGIIETSLNVGHADSAQSLLQDLGVLEIRVDVQRGIGRGALHLQIQDPMAELCGQCSNGKLCINAFGDVYPCVFARFAHLGSIDQGLTTILNGSALSTFRTQQTKHLSRTAQTFSHHASHMSLSSESAQNAICGPDIICGPDRACSPNCLPASSKCVPSLSRCLPDVSCPPVGRIAPISGSQ